MLPGVNFFIANGALKLNRCNVSYCQNMYIYINVSKDSSKMYFFIFAISLKNVHMLRKLKTNIQMNDEFF